MSDLFLKIKYSVTAESLSLVLFLFLSLIKYVKMGVSVSRLTWKFVVLYVFAPKELQSFDKNSTTQYTLKHTEVWLLWNTRAVSGATA